MSTKTLLTLFLPLVLAACDVDIANTAPQDYEQAKADCTAHSGLSYIETRTVLLRPNRVDAICNDDTHISRFVPRKLRTRTKEQT